MGNTDSRINYNSKSGYLVKQESESKQLRRHYVVLTDHTLRLYEDEFRNNNTECIDLNGFTDIILRPYGESDRFQLKLSKSDTKNYVLFIASAMDASDWYKHIMDAIPNKVDILPDNNESKMEEEPSDDSQHVHNKSFTETELLESKSFTETDVSLMKRQMGEKDMQLLKLKIQILQMENEKLTGQKVEALNVAEMTKREAEEKEKYVMEKDKEIQLLKENSKYFTVWQWKENDGRFISYDADISQKIEKLAINKSIKYYDSKKTKQLYKITKKSETTAIQINTKTKKIRQIIRKKKPIDALILEKEELKEKAEDIGYIIKWQWDETPWDKNNGYWISYDTKISKKIEALDISQSLQFKCSKNDQSYKIIKKSKNTAHQINIVSKVQRPCRRYREKVEDLINEAEKYKLKAEEEEKKIEQKENEYNKLKEKIGYKIVWEIDDSNKNTWRALIDWLSMKIEKLNIGQLLTFTGNDQQQYSIYRLSKVTAVKLLVSDPSQAWPCRRMEITSCLNQIQYPEWWFDRKTSNSGYVGSELITLKLDDPAVAEVKNLFNNTTLVGYQIAEIQGVKNKMLYEKYWNERHLVMKAVGKDKLNESYLFHGARTEDVMDSVMLQGWRKEFNKNAKYGKGTYFAKRASYAIQYAAKSTQYPDEYKIFVAKVILGESVVGKGSYELATWPIKTNGLIYDSLVNNAKYPSIFVIHENVRAYPMFIIHFKDKYAIHK